MMSCKTPIYIMVVGIMVVAFMLFVIIQQQYQINTLSTANNSLWITIDRIIGDLPEEAQNDILNGLRPPIQ